MPLSPPATVALLKRKMIVERTSREINYVTKARLAVITPSNLKAATIPKN